MPEPGPGEERYPEMSLSPLRNMALVRPDKAGWKGAERLLAFHRQEDRMLTSTVCDIAQTSPVPGANGKLDYAITQVNRNVTNCDALAEMAAHEFGHTLGLTGHCTAQTGCNSPTASIMTTAAPGAYDASGNLVNPNAIKGTAGHSYHADGVR